MLLLLKSEIYQSCRTTDGTQRFKALFLRGVIQIQLKYPFNTPKCETMDNNLGCYGVARWMLGLLSSEKEPTSNTIQ